MTPFSIPYPIQDIAAAGLVALALVYILGRIRHRPRAKSCPGCGVSASVQSPPRAQ